MTNVSLQATSGTRIWQNVVKFQEIQTCLFHSWHFVTALQTIPFLPLSLALAHLPSELKGIT